MRDSTLGKHGTAWAIMVLIRFLCSRRGAAGARAAIIVSACILTGLMTLGATVGRWAVEKAWDRFVALETSIAAMRQDFRDYQLDASYRTKARDHQVTDIQLDVDKLKANEIIIDHRVTTLEVRR